MSAGVAGRPHPAGDPRLPDFIAIGPPRTGTTWLYRALSGRVGLPRDTKETDFFSDNYGRGIEWYLDFFRDCPADLPIGEVSPNYFAAPQAPDRIAASVPDCRIICTLRDPVDRLYSFYRLMRHNGWTRASVEEIASGSSPAIEASRYAHYLRRWRERFGTDRVMVAFYEDLENTPQQFLDSICGFIGINRIALDGSPLLGKRVNSVTRGPRVALLAEKAWRLRRWLEGRNAVAAIAALRKMGVWRFSFRGGGEFGPLDPKIEQSLRERFRPEVEALEEMVGRDLSDWKKNASAKKRKIPKYSDKTDMNG